MRRDPFLLQSEAIRQHLVILVRQAVVRAGGCLGTFYKNLQVHHMEYNSGDMYDDVPAVVSVEVWLVLPVDMRVLCCTIFILHLMTG